MVREGEDPTKCELLLFLRFCLSGRLREKREKREGEREEGGVRESEGHVREKRAA